MSDLVAFIEARLAEDEAHARKDLHLIQRATPLEQWTIGYGYNLPYSLIGDDGAIGRLSSTRGQPLADGEDDLHQADAMLVGRLVRRAERHAARALREVEAKRLMLAQYAAVCDEVRNPKSAEHRQNARVRQFQLEEMLPLLASAWSDHPECRAE